MIATVTSNPYQLAADIYGIGFVTADAIGRNIGVAPDSEFRYRAGIIHVLGEAAEDGHCFLPHTELVERVTQRLTLKDHQPSPPMVADLLFQMGMEDQIILQGHQEHQYICYQPSFFHSEQKLAERLNQLLNRPVQVDTARVSNWISKFTAATGMQLSPQQRQAVEMSASERVLLLTGGSGCGRTFTARTIVALWKAIVFASVVL